jgi:hypothetical protein
MSFVPGQKTRTFNMADEQKIILQAFDGLKVMEIEFSVAEQHIEISIYGNTGVVSNPINIAVDTQMLGLTESEE